MLATTSAQAAGPVVCSVQARSLEQIVLICTPDAGEQVWRVRSQAACADHGRCNVWIWEERARAPQVAPRSDVQVSMLRAAGAVAVWINESQTLFKLRPRR